MLWFLSFKKYAWKTFRILPYAWKQNIFFEMNLFFDFFFKFKRKPNIFNTGFVSYNISLQPNIMQNCWKNMRENHKYFEMTLGIFLDIYIYIIFIFIILLNINWAGPGLAIRAGLKQV
jgi:hypothetical protein